MKIYKTTFEALEYISSTNLSYGDKLCKKDNILSRGIAKINNTIIIVDEYGLLD